MASPYEMPVLPAMPFARSLGAADEEKREAWLVICTDEREKNVNESFGRLIHLCVPAFQEGLGR